MTAEACAEELKVDPRHRGTGLLAQALHNAIDLTPEAGAGDDDAVVSREVDAIIVVPPARTPALHGAATADKDRTRPDRRIRNSPHGS